MMKEAATGRKKIVVIGGGTGTVAVLSGLKRFPHLDLSVIVSMTDDGGSNAVVRDEFGILPLSDLRKSIIALADDERSSLLLRQLFTYRFAKGKGLASHTLGNLMMMALTDIMGTEAAAVEAASELFDVVGDVVPVTFDDVRLVAHYANGKRIQGEHLIDEPLDEEIVNSKITKLELDKSAEANPQALQKVAQADFVIIGPGDLYTSTLANIVVPGMPAALRETQAQKIMITNLMTKKGQTHWMSLKDFVEELEDYCEAKMDHIFVNSGEMLPEVLAHYAEDDEHPLQDDLGEDRRVRRVDLVAGQATQKDKGDELVRSLIRHDAIKLANALRLIIDSD